MLLNFDELVEKYQMRITGILHVGAHLAEEAASYAQHGIEQVYWVEANPIVLPKLKTNLAAYPTQKLIPALLTDTDGEVIPFHVTNYDGMSSSILEFGTHPQFSPDTVFEHELMLCATTIDRLYSDNQIPDNINMLVMDVQGAEKQVVDGGGSFMVGIDYVMSEVNNEEVYVGCTKIEELDDRFEPLGLTRVETYWVPNQGWGDGLWIRRK